MPPSSPKQPRSGARLLRVPRFLQPDDVSCGPTCLQQVYHYFDDPQPYEQVARGISRNEDGGTLAVHLALGAIRRGYGARIYSYNLRIFDPTWHRLPAEEVRRKLRRRARAVRRPKLRTALLAYEEFLACGGSVRFPELRPELLVRILDRGRPVLTGLSATYLYRQIRERPDDNVDDDIRGEPVGHFVVISGHSGGGKRFTVNDPSPHAPFSKRGRYAVAADRLINSILLGELTYDAVLLELWPRKRGGKRT